MAGLVASPEPPKRWKNIGYPAYSELIGSDNELFILRRFSTLSARIILALQDRLNELEQELSDVDNRYRHGDEDVNNGSFRYETQEDRLAILKKIKEKLKEYSKPNLGAFGESKPEVSTDEFVSLHAEMKSKPNALRRQTANLKNWHDRNHNAILEDERAYIDQSDDLTTIIPISRTPLRKALERTEWFKTSNFFRRSPARSQQDETVFYHNDTRMQAFDSGTVMLVGLAMLLAPIWILYTVKTPRYRLGVISAFVTAFMVLLQVVTTAKPSESLAATAA